MQGIQGDETFSQVLARLDLAGRIQEGPISLEEVAKGPSLLVCSLLDIVPPSAYSCSRTERPLRVPYRIRLR